MSTTPITHTPPTDGKAKHPGVPSLFAALIVEDDEVTSHLLSLALDRRLGAIVRTAPSAEEAVPYIVSAIDWDAVLIDIGLPKADGLQLLAFSKRHCPKAVHIIVSSRDSDEDKEAARKAGADAYLTKPLSTSALIQAVGSIVSGRLATQTSDGGVTT